MDKYQRIVVGLVLLHLLPWCIVGQDSDWATEWKKNYTDYTFDTANGTLTYPLQLCVANRPPMVFCDYTKEANNFWYNSSNYTGFDLSFLRQANTNARYLIPFLVLVAIV
jgi:hypothetical protein